MVGIAALLAIGGVILWTVRVIFPPLVLAGAIVFILNPVVTWLQHRSIPRAGGAALAYLGVIAIVAGAGAVVVPLASDQAAELREEWPDIRARSERWIDDRAAESENWIVKLPSVAEIESEFGTSDRTLSDQLDQVRAIGVRIFHVLLIFLLGPILAFYLLVDLPSLRRTALSLIPPRSEAEILHVAHRLNRAIGGFFRGQLAVALIVGVMCSIGLAAIGLQFWFLVGMIAGVFNLVPLIGPWIGGIPGVVIALTTGSPVKALLVVAIMAGAQQVDNHLITPYVMQRAVRLHPAAVVLALLAGGSLGGFFGLLLAVPVAAVLKILIGHVWRIHVLGESLPDAAVVEAADDAEPGVGVVKELGARAPGEDVVAQP